MRSAVALDRLKDPRVATYTTLLAVPAISGDLLPDTAQGILLNGAVTMLLMLVLWFREAPGVEDLIRSFRQWKVLLFFVTAAGLFGLGGYVLLPGEGWLEQGGLAPPAAAATVVVVLAVSLWAAVTLGMRLLLGRDLDRELAGVIVGMLLAATVLSPGLSTAVLAEQIANLVQALGLALLMAETLSA